MNDFSTSSSTVKEEYNGPTSSSTSSGLNSNKDRIAIIKFTFTAGVLIRGQFRRFLEKEKFQRSNLKINYKEDKGFLDSEFFVTIEGKYGIASQWHEDFQEMCRCFDDE